MVVERLYSFLRSLASMFTSVSAQEISITNSACDELAPFDVQSKSFMRLRRRLYFSIFDLERTSIVALHELNSNFLIIPFAIGSKSMLPNGSEVIVSKGPISLAEIYNFDCMMRAAVRQNQNTKLVLCAGTSPAVRARALLLLGCHMILSLGASLKRTCQAFAPLHGLPEFPISEHMPVESDSHGITAWSEELTPASCWGTLDAAMAQGWIDLGRPFDAGVEGNSQLCMEEYLHYSEYGP